MFVSEQELSGVFSDPSRIVAYPDGNVVRLISFGFCEKRELRSLDVVETSRPIIEAYISPAFARSAFVG